MCIVNYALKIGVTCVFVARFKSLSTSQLACLHVSTKQCVTGKNLINKTVCVNYDFFMTERHGLGVVSTVTLL